MSAATLDMPTKPKPRTDQTPTGRRVLAARVALERLVFTGFMGSGKTSVGSLVADRLGWRFLDLDHEIEARHNRTVPQIFAESGEAQFRRLESATLASLLGQRHVVVALGGGAPEELGNRLLLEQTPHTAVVYLAAPFATLLDRCNLQALDPAATTRPNLADLTAAKRRFHLRRTQYERIAAHTIDTSSLSLEEAADAVLELLRSGAQ